MFIPYDELNIGQIIEVSGTAIKVEINSKISELSRTFNGRVYPIGQIGSMVKVHYGRQVILGLVTMLRMQSDELNEDGHQIDPSSDQRLMEVQLLAECHWNASKEKLTLIRGIKTYPLPQQGVYLLTNNELVEVYQSAEGKIDDDISLRSFAHYSAAEAIPCRANINKMFGMHCAVLGSTGSGKSATVAAIIHSLLEPEGSQDELKPQVIIIDPHGEYGTAFRKHAIEYQAYEFNQECNEHSERSEHEAIQESVPQKQIKLPYWLMSSDEFTNLILGKSDSSASSQSLIVQKALKHARLVQAGVVKAAPSEFGETFDGKSLDKPLIKDNYTDRDILAFDIDKPKPFCLDEFYNHIKYIQSGKIEKGALSSLPDSKLTTSSAVLNKLNALRNDSRLGFLMDNTQEEPSNLSDILKQFISTSCESESNKSIKIVDISGLPNEVASPLTAVITRLLFQYKIIQTDEQRENDPILFVCEEAHRYVPDHGEAQYAIAQNAIRRIAREGRKYGLGLMLVSQRPSDVDGTVISQCGTWVVLRLTNSTDQQHVAKFLPDGLTGMVSALPILAQQEAIFIGEGAAMPARIRIKSLEEDQLPRSNTIPFADGWSKPNLDNNTVDQIAQKMSQ